MPRKPGKEVKPKSIFVLDTNVLLHDPYSLFKFEEHDVYVPFVTIEELDGKKSGTQDLNRHARQATRNIEEAMQSPCTPDGGYPLAREGAAQPSGRLFVQDALLPFLAHEFDRKNDNLYLSVLSHLQSSGWAPVMVTKDLNLRIKARAMGFCAQDYMHDHSVQDQDVVSSVIKTLPDDYLSVAGDQLTARSRGVQAEYTLPHDGTHQVNDFLLIGEELYRVTDLDGSRLVVRSVADRTKPKNAVFNIAARNDEQVAALELLLDPDVDLVALLGRAGTGKTLMTVAAALQQIVRDDLYDELLFTRATIPLGEDIGFLPGSEEEKMAPWMGALWDNLEVAIEAAGDSEVTRHRTRERVQECVSARAITFMRGRTFLRKFVVIDEAQNLTPKQMKALITRAGPETKVVCLGNLEQIDSPYLTEHSSGLAYLVNRFKGWKHFGALVLSKGERSRLAEEANDRL